MDTRHIVGLTLLLGAGYVVYKLATPQPKPKRKVAQVVERYSYDDALYDTENTPEAIEVSEASAMLDDLADSGASSDELDNAEARYHEAKLAYDAIVEAHYEANK